MLGILVGEATAQTRKHGWAAVPSRGTLRPGVSVSGSFMGDQVGPPPIGMLGRRCRAEARARCFAAAALGVVG